MDFMNLDNLISPVVIKFTANIRKILHSATGMQERVLNFCSRKQEKQKKYGTRGGFRIALDRKNGELNENLYTLHSQL
jgi:hypothetical protein